MTAVVGVTPSGMTGAPIRALMKADLPALNSPTMTSRKSSARLRMACWRSSRSSSVAGKAAIDGGEALEDGGFGGEQVVLLAGRGWCPHHCRTGLSCQSGRPRAWVCSWSRWAFVAGANGAPGRG